MKIIADLISVAINTNSSNQLLRAVSDFLPDFKQLSNIRLAAQYDIIIHVLRAAIVY